MQSPIRTRLVASAFAVGMLVTGAAGTGMTANAATVTLPAATSVATPGTQPAITATTFDLSKQTQVGFYGAADGNVKEGLSDSKTIAVTPGEYTVTYTAVKGSDKGVANGEFSATPHVFPASGKVDTSGDGKYTLADLDDVTINADGKAVWRDGKETGTPVSKTSRIVVDNTPGGWTAKASLGTKALTVTFTAPDKTPVTVTIDYKATTIDIDLSKVSDAANPGFGTLGIVSVTDPADTPKPVNPTDNRQPHTVADQYQGITPGEYQITYTAVNDEDATKHQQPTVNGTWYSASTTTNGIFGSATGSTSRPITVAADWYKPADGKQTPTSVNVDMPAGSFMNLEGGPKAGILHLTRVGDLPQAGTPTDKDGQAAPIRPIVDASRPGDSLPHTGAGTLMPAVMGILFGALGMVGVRMRRHA